MLKKRQEIYRKAKEDKITVQEYRRRIGRWYKRQGWTFLDGTLNPFKMMESPKAKKKRKDFKAFKKKTEEKLFG